MDLFMSPDADPAYSMSSQLQSITDSVTRFQTPPMRVLDGTIVTATNGTHLEQWSYNGDGVVFGNGLHYPRQSWFPGLPATKLLLFTDFIGQLGETRSGDHSSTVTTALGGDSSALA